MRFLLSLHSDACTVTKFNAMIFYLILSEIVYDLHETYVLSIEVESARLACTNIYDTTLAKMQNLVEALSKEPEDPTEILYRFHYLLTAASGNSVYSMIYRGFETMLCTLIRQHYSMRSEDIKETAQLHGQLLDAIIRKDERAAQNLARRILTRGILVLQGRYS